MPSAKLNMVTARLMRAERKRGATYPELALRFGVARATVCRVCLNYSYREPWMPRKYQPREATEKIAKCEWCLKPFRYWHRGIDPPRRFCGRGCALRKANQPKKKVPSSEELSHLYHVRGWSLQRIAIKYGCCFQAVQSAMKRAGIKRRSIKSAGQTLQPRRLSTIVASMR